MKVPTPTTGAPCTVGLSHQTVRDLLLALLTVYSPDNAPTALQFHEGPEPSALSNVTARMLGPILGRQITAPVALTVEFGGEPATERALQRAADALALEHLDGLNDDEPEEAGAEAGTPPPAMRVEGFPLAAVEVRFTWESYGPALALAFDVDTPEGTQRFAMPSMAIPGSGFRKRIVREELAAMMLAAFGE